LRLAAPGREPDSRRFAQLTHRYKSFNVSLTPHEASALYVLPGTLTGFSPRYQTLLGNWLKIFPHNVLIFVFSPLCSIHPSRSFHVIFSAQVPPPQNPKNFPATYLDDQ
jgi:hypothetical protein